MRVYPVIVMKMALFIMHVNDVRRVKYQKLFISHRRATVIIRRCPAEVFEELFLQSIFPRWETEEHAVVAAVGDKEENDREGFMEHRAVLSGGMCEQ